jgi:hypothetical protein
LGWALAGRISSWHPAIIGNNGTTYTISANASGAATVTVGQSEFNFASRLECY